jgi:hypothetical protein
MMNGVQAGARVAQKPKRESAASQLANLDRWSVSPGISNARSIDP